MLGESTEDVDLDPGEADGAIDSAPRGGCVDVAIEYVTEFVHPVSCGDEGRWVVVGRWSR